MATQPIEFTAQEIALLNQVLSQLTVNPAAPDAVDICMIVRSIQQKINPAQEPIEVKE